MHAPVYDDAKKRGDTKLPQDDLVKAISPTATPVFAYDEQLSKRDSGIQNPNRSSSCTANNLEADHIGELLDVFRKRGYRFITLEDALSDQAYGMPDTYVGEEGTRLALIIGRSRWVSLRKAPRISPVGHRPRQGAAPLPAS